MTGRRMRPHASAWRGVQRFCVITKVLHTTLVISIVTLALGQGVPSDVGDFDLMVVGKATLDQVLSGLATAEKGIERSIRPYIQ